MSASRSAWGHTRVHLCGRNRGGSADRMLIKGGQGDSREAAALTSTCTGVLTGKSRCGTARGEGPATRRYSPARTRWEDCYPTKSGPGRAVTANARRRSARHRAASRSTSRRESPRTRGRTGPSGGHRDREPKKGNSHRVRRGIKSRSSNSRGGVVRDRAVHGRSSDKAGRVTEGRKSESGGGRSGRLGADRRVMTDDCV